jgi:hypothetical protein
MANCNSLSLRGREMLKAGAKRQEVKRYFTSNRVRARVAVTMLCKQEMVILRSAHFSNPD